MAELKPVVKKPAEPEQEKITQEQVDSHIAGAVRLLQQTGVSTAAVQQIIALIQYAFKVIVK